jgi:hypothetical protein
VGELATSSAGDTHRGLATPQPQNANEMEYLEEDSSLYSRIPRETADIVIALDRDSAQSGRNRLVKMHIEDHFAIVERGETSKLNFEDATCLVESNL